MTYINREELVDLMKNLIEIPSPYFEEDMIMEFGYNYLLSKGLKPEIHNYHEANVTNFKGKNLIGKLEGSEGKHIYLNGHLDTVKVCNGWTKNPLEPIIDGDKLFGLGILDMKSGCGAIMIALGVFQKIVKSFEGVISYSLVSDEEGPFGLGTTYLINDGLVGQPDIAIITEPSAGFARVKHPNIALGARGGYNYTIKVKGLSSHAAEPEKGINALVEASKIILEIEKTQMIEDDKLGKGSNAVIEIRAEKSACSIPDYCEIEVFRHIVRGESKDTIEEEIKVAIKKAKVVGEISYEFREAPTQGFDGGFLPYVVGENNPFVESLKASIKDVCGEEPSISYFRSIGDFNSIGGLMNIPTIIFGPEGDNYHSGDEFVSINSTLEVAESIVGFLIKETKAELY